MYTIMISAAARKSPEAGCIAQVLKDRKQRGEVQRSFVDVSISKVRAAHVKSQGNCRTQKAPDRTLVGVLLRQPRVLKC